VTKKERYLFPATGRRRVAFFFGATGKEIIGGKIKTFGICGNLSTECLTLRF